MLFRPLFWVFVAVVVAAAVAFVFVVVRTVPVNRIVPKDHPDGVCAVDLRTSTRCPIRHLVDTRSL